MSASVGCSRQEHDAIKTRVEYFLLETVNHRTWESEHLLVGECRLCSSSLTLALCRLCNEAMPSDDMLPWGQEEDHFCHVECAMRAMMPEAKTKFVILVGGGKAVEFTRQDATSLELVRS